jgi:hypothetical protein
MDRLPVWSIGGVTALVGFWRHGSAKTNGNSMASNQRRPSTTTAIWNGRIQRRSLEAGERQFVDPDGSLSRNRKYSDEDAVRIYAGVQSRLLDETEPG